MKISDILQKKQSLSFEFFPPKEPSQESVLFETINELKPFAPDFTSITYGAGGSTRDKTMVWSQILAKDFTTMMHLTCYGNDSTSINKTCEAMKAAGITNILVLRGD